MCRAKMYLHINSFDQCMKIFVTDELKRLVPVPTGNQQAEYPALQPPVFSGPPQIIPQIKRQNAMEYPPQNSNSNFDLPKKSTRDPNLDSSDDEEDDAAM